MRNDQGFSLLELIVVMVIASILAALAIPAYRRYVLRSHRVDAVRALHELAARQERYFFMHNRYTAALDALGSAENAAGPYYSLDISSADESDYSVTAIASGIQTQDSACASLSLDRAGVQRSTGDVDNQAACWGR